MSEYPFVDLVASGYEWTCPLCDKGNTEIALPRDGRVSCSFCDAEFTIGSFNHAM